jgi:CheY-like chemotaxis protein
VPKRVLLLDQDDASRETLCAMLVHDGHVVDDARTMGDALARLDAALARNRRYDLLLAVPCASDDAEGACGVIDAARARWPDIQVGVVVPGATAAGGHPCAVHETCASRADFTLPKPVRSDELLALVDFEQTPPPLTDHS